MLTALLWATPAAGGESERPPRVDMAAAATVAQAAPGKAFEIVVTLTLPRGYHIYWQDPGASGMPTRIRVAAPDGCRVGPTRFPRPVLIDEPSGRVRAHVGTVHFAVAVTPPDSWPIGTPIPLTVQADWLICREQCWLGEAAIDLTIPVGPQRGPTTAAMTSAGKLPRGVTTRLGTTVEIDGNMVRISGPVDPAGTPGFLAIYRPGLTLTPPIVSHDGERFELTAAVTYDASGADGVAARLQGLLTFGAAASDPAWVVDHPLLEDTTAVNSPEQGAPE